MPDSREGHCGGAFDIDEGGEVRLEYITFLDGNIGARGTAFAYKDPGTPRYHDFINQMGTCVDTRASAVTTLWPFAQNADREYLDVGPEIDVLGTSQPIYRLSQTTDSGQPDLLGRTHALWYFDDAAADETGGDAYLTPGETYDVVFPGSSEFAGHIFDKAIYIPQDFALDTPGLDGTTMVLAANTDLALSWGIANDAPSGVEVLSLVMFTGAVGPAVMCIEPNDGEIVVPGASIDIARSAYPTGGTIVRQTLTHQVRDLPDPSGDVCDRRRIDMIGVRSYAGQSYSAN
jgi:hypothetical protein